MSFIESRLYDSSGSVRLEFSGLLPNYDPEDGESVSAAIELIRQKLTSKQQVSITGINYYMIKDVLYVLVDANYPDTLTINQVTNIEKTVSAATKLSIKLFINLQTSTVLSSSGYEPYWSVSRKGFQRQSEAMKNEVRQIIEASKM